MIDIRTRRELEQGADEVLDKIIELLKTNTPFIHLRFGDGEMECMFDNTPNKKNGDGCIYYTDLRLELLDTLIKIADVKDNDRILIGNAFTKPEHLKHLEERNKVDTINWTCACALGCGLINGKSFEIINLLLNLPRKKVLVGNITLSPIAKAWKMEHIICATHNNWLEHEKIKNDLLKYIDDNPVILYCGGIGIKPIVWQMWEHNNNSIQFDIGSFFDPAVGVYNRLWTTANRDNRFNNYIKYIKPLLLNE